MGELKGIYDASSFGEPGKESKVQNSRLRGFAALLLWRFAYWGRQTSVANKILIPMHWFKTFVFGRGKWPKRAISIIVRAMYQTHVVFLCTIVL